MSAYGRVFTVVDHYGLAHIAQAYRHKHTWRYAPWCDARMDVAGMLGTEKANQRRTPPSCFACLQIAKHFS